jgi:hypothetical protein
VAKTPVRIAPNVPPRYERRTQPEEPPRPKRSFSGTIQKQKAPAEADEQGGHGTNESGGGCDGDQSSDGA